MAPPLIPKRVEYALKILVCLAQSPQQPISARQAARCVCITQSQAARILYLLTWAGLARSRRGSKGGFVLVRAPENIRVREVMKFFHVPIEENASRPDDPLLGVWRAMTTDVEQAWEQLTIADLVGRTVRPGFYVCRNAETEGNTCNGDHP